MYLVSLPNYMLYVADFCYMFMLLLLFSFQHNLFCDNCHSHVARALNLMQYDNSTSWNMYKLGFLMVFRGKFVRYDMIIA